MPRVVTYQSPGDTCRVSLCRRCARLLRRAGKWPRDGAGAELCSVYMGLHAGPCHRCTLRRSGRDLNLS